MENLNVTIISKIVENIPSNIKLVNYLMDTLTIGRESAYRRIRNQVPFTLDEIRKLSVDFDFSLGEITRQNKEKRVFIDVKENSFHNPQETFNEMFKTYYDVVSNMCKAKDKGAISAVNQLNFQSLLTFEHMFKFYYYKWMHQLHGVSPTLSYSETIIPPEILSLKNEFQLLVKRMKQAKLIYIFDQYVFLNTIREIRYYYKRGLISDEELHLIKKDFHGIIDLFENLVQKGINDTGSSFHFYLSILNIESNSSYIHYDDESEVFFSLYTVSPMRMNNQETCFMQKQWLDSLKKYSTLITQCNEFLQVKYFSKQREYLESIENYSFFSFFEE